MNKILTAAALCFSMGTAASAATLTIDNGTAGSIPGGSLINEFLLAPIATEAGLSNPQAGFFDSEVNLATSSTASVKVEVYGYEAGFMNTFAFGGSSYTSGGGLEIAPDLASPLASWVVNSLSAGLLDFTLSTSGGVADPSVDNGDVNDNSFGNANFFATMDADGAVWLFFDDAGGSANDDDNHDDLVVRLSAVPLPAGAVLLLSGLGIMGLRRKLAS